MARDPSPHDLAFRIQALVDRYFGGNVRKAALAWGIPQPTAHRLTTGKTDHPRKRTVEAIAAYHETTPDWLLLGTGPNPLTAPAFPPVEQRDYRAIVKGLGLNPETERAVMGLPTGTAMAHHALCRWGLFGGGHPERSEAVVRVARHTQLGATALQYQSWSLFLSGLIRAYGLDAVRDKLQHEIPRILVGFMPLGMAFLDDEAAAARADTLIACLGTGGDSAPATFINAPRTPPLDAKPPQRRRGRPRRIEPVSRYDAEEEGI